MARFAALRTSGASGAAAICLSAFGWPLHRLSSCSAEIAEIIHALNTGYLPGGLDQDNLLFDLWQLQCMRRLLKRMLERKLF